MTVHYFANGGLVVGQLESSSLGDAPLRPRDRSLGNAVNHGSKWHSKELHDGYGRSFTWLRADFDCHGIYYRLLCNVRNLAFSGLDISVDYLQFHVIGLKNLFWGCLLDHGEYSAI